jgi:hypothetical protein
VRDDKYKHSKKHYSPSELIEFEIVRDDTDEATKHIDDGLQESKSEAT